MFNRQVVNVYTDGQSRRQKRGCGGCMTVIVWIIIIMVIITLLSHI